MQSKLYANNVIMQRKIFKKKKKNASLISRLNFMRHFTKFFQRERDDKFVQDSLLEVRREKSIYLIL